MLRRRTFESVDAIRDALRELGAEPAHAGA